MKRQGILFGALFLIVVALATLNYYLWKSQEDKRHRIESLKTQIGLHRQENQQLDDRNGTLLSDVQNLRSPNAYFVYEEKARENYGMIGQNETFFVLPDNELAGFPDVPGLDEVQAKVVNPDEAPLTPEPNRSNNSKQTATETIPVTPIPLQLESLQE